MAFDCLDIENVSSFDWDEGNIDKNERKHGLKWNIIEELFFNEPLIIAQDAKHSGDECRCVAFGKIDSGERITVVFVRRGHKIRVISARPMSRKERMFYEKH